MPLLLTCAVAVTWLAILTLAFGLGALLLRPGTELGTTWADAFATTLCGLALLFAALLLWHFWLPVNRVPLVLFTAAGTAGCVRERRWLKDLVRGPFSRIHVLPILVVWVWAANHVLLPGAWDDYLYEFQTTRWFHDYAIVPGLANLHGRFGFNTSHHLFAALLSAGPWAGAVNLLVNGPFLLLVVARAWVACVELLHGRVSPRNVFIATFMAPCLARFLDSTDPAQPSAATLKGDVAGGALAILCACLWLECMDRSTSPSRRALLAVASGLGAAMLVTIRMVSAPFAFALMVGTAVVLLRQSVTRMLPLTAAGAVAVVLVLTPPARGVILSGYPVYPAPVLAAPVDWRVPRVQADVERAFITAHAQVRSSDAGAGAGWVARWAYDSLLRNRVTVAVPVLIALSIVPALIRRRNVAAADVPPEAWIILLGGAAITLALWWWNAPAFRFAWGYLWIGFAALLAATCRHAPAALMSVWPAVILVTGAVLMSTWQLPRSEVLSFASPVLFATGWAAAYCLLDKTRPIAMLIMALGIYPIVDRLAADILHRRGADVVKTLWLNVDRMPRAGATAGYVERATISGLTVRETKPLGSYETPLPNTPFFNPYLELRRPPDLSGGFRNKRHDVHPVSGIAHGSPSSGTRK